MIDTTNNTRCRVTESGRVPRCYRNAYGAWGAGAWKQVEGGVRLGAALRDAVGACMQGEREPAVSAVRVLRSLGKLYGQEDAAAFAAFDPGALRCSCRGLVSSAAAKAQVDKQRP